MQSLHTVSASLIGFAVLNPFLQGFRFIIGRTDMEKSDMALELVEAYIVNIGMVKGCCSAQLTLEIPLKPFSHANIHHIP